MKDEVTEYLYALYFQAFSQLRHEGEAIWSRFNIMFTIDAGLLAAFAFLQHSNAQTLPLLKIIDYKIVIVTLTILGIAFSLMAAMTIRQLWAWHNHWFEKAATLEAQLSIQKNAPEISIFLLAKSPKTRGGPSAKILTHQNFFGAFSLIWIILLCIQILGL